VFRPWESRRRWAGPAMVMAAVAGTALAAALVRIPTADGRQAKPAAPPSRQVAVLGSAHPTVSVAYATVSPGPAYPMDPPSGLPPRDAPLPLQGTCPASVDLMRLPIINPWDVTTWPDPVTAVTLCRYANSTLDTSDGHNILVQGPVVGDLAAFGPALAKALPPVRPIDHVGCRIVNPGPPYAVDIVFVATADDTGTAYLMLRSECDPPWLEDPERTLRESVDAVLGPPY